LKIYIVKQPPSRSNSTMSIFENEMIEIDIRNAYTVNV
jgi:hypothetical protein